MCGKTDPVKFDDPEVQELLLELLAELKDPGVAVFLLKALTRADDSPA